MSDFLISIILTFLISIITFAFEIIAFLVIFAISVILALRSGIRGETQRTAQRYYNDMPDFYIFGTGLAGLAISIGLAALGIWIKNKALFPFFSKFDTKTVSYEVPAWIIFLGAHLLLLILALICEQLSPRIKAPKLKWIAIVSTNSIGVVALLLSMSVILNAL